MSVVSGTFHTARRALKAAATSTSEVPTAALVVSTIGLLGLVDWPVVVGVGVGGLILQRVNRTNGESAQDAAATAAASSNGSNSSATRTTTRSTPKKTARRRAGSA